MYTKRPRQRKTCWYTEKWAMVIQHKHSRQILTTRERQRGEKNWGNIYRVALALPDDPLEQWRWNTQQEKHLVQGKAKEDRHMSRRQEWQLRKTFKVKAPGGCCWLPLMWRKWKQLWRCWCCCDRWLLYVCFVFFLTLSSSSWSLFD